MKKVPDVGVARKRGRPPKKQLASQASTPSAPGEGAQLLTTDIFASDVHVAQTSAATSSSEKPNESNNLKPKKGVKSTALDSAKMISRKRRQTSSDRTGSDGKRLASSNRKSLKDKMNTLLPKTVKQKTQTVSQQLQSSPSRPLSEGKPKRGLQISQKRKAKLRKFRSSKISRNKSTKTQADELKDNLTPEMRRLMTTDGFWSTKAPSSPHNQSIDSHLQGQTTASKKDSRTSTPDNTPTGARKQSLSKTRQDKDDITPQKSNIPVPELRRLRATEGFAFPEPSGASRMSSRDVSPCSSSSLDRGTRLNSRPFSRGNENKNGMKVDDADAVAIAEDIVSARNKITVKKESCSGKDKLLGDQKEVSSALTPKAADADKFINCESPVSRFRKKHLSHKAANITKQRFSANSQSKKTQATGSRHRLKSKVKAAQSIAAAESSGDTKPFVSTNMPEVKKDRKLPRHAVDKRIREKTIEKKRKGKQKQRTISNVDTLVPQPVIEDGSEHVPAASNISSINDVSSTMSNTPADLLISDILGSAELKRLNTTAGFWSSTSGETFLSIDKPRKLRDADDNSIKEATVCVKRKTVRQKSLHSAQFLKTAVTSTSSLLQLRKKKLHSLQSKLMKTKQSVPSNDLAEQRQSSVDSLSPAPTEAGAGRKSRPRARLFGAKRLRRNRHIALNDSEDINMQEVQTTSGSFSVVNSEVNAAGLKFLEKDANVSKSVKEGHANLSSSEINNKESIVSGDCLIAKDESCQGNNTSKEPVDLAAVSQTMPETPAEEMDTSGNYTPTGLKPLVKTSKKGRGKLIPREVLETPSSSIRTRRRGKVENTLESSLGAQQNMEPNNKDALLASSPVTAKVVSEKQKLKKQKKESLDNLDLSEGFSRPEIDNKSSQPDDIKIPQINENENDNLPGTKISTAEADIEKHVHVGRQNLVPTKVNLFESSEALQHLEPKNEDALLALSPVNSKVASEKRKLKKGKKESLEKLDLAEDLSRPEIDNKSSHPDEIKIPQMNENENDNLPGTKINTAEVDIEKNDHVGRQNVVPTKVNLFESLGYSLNVSSDTSPISCVNNSLTCDVRDSLNVSESQFMAQNLPATENLCEMKLSDCLCVSQTELSGKHVSDSIENINHQQLKDAELGVTDVSKESLNDSVEKMDAGCHTDSFVDTSESLHGLQSVFLSDSAVSSGPINQGSEKADALNATSVCERQDCALSANIPVAEIKAVTMKDHYLASESSGVIGSSFCSQVNITKERTTTHAPELEYDGLEKQCINEDNKVTGEKELINTLEGAKTEPDVGKLKLAEPGVDVEVSLPHEASTEPTPTSADIGLFEEFLMFAKAELGKSNNISTENFSEDNREQCGMSPGGSMVDTEGAVGNTSVSVKPVVDTVENVGSVAAASDDELEVPETVESSCGHTKPQKRKKKETGWIFRRKVRKQMVETTDLSISLDSTSLDVSSVSLVAVYDFNSYEENAENKQNEGLQETNNMIQVPVKKVKKRRKNAWQRGVLRKGGHMSRKVKKSTKSESPEQIDVSISVLNSNDAKICFTDDTEKLDAVNSVLLPNVGDENQMSDCLHENIELRALGSNCENGREISSSLQLWGQSASAALNSDSSPKISDLADSKTHISDGSKIQVSDDSKIQKVSEDSKTQVSDDSKIQEVSDDSKIQEVSDDSKIQEVSDDCKIQEVSDDCKIQEVSDDSKTQVSDDSKIKDTDDSRLYIDDSHIKDLDESKIEESGENKVCDLNNSKIKDSDENKILISDDNQKNYIPVPFFTSNCDTPTQVSDNLGGESGPLVPDAYPPAVTKSLKNMLKKLQTDANLAHADVGVQSYKGKFLRNIQQEKEKRLNIRRQLLHAEQKVEEGSKGTVALEPQVGIVEMPVKKKRGRPKKQTGEALPKLSPVSTFPLLRFIAPWNKTPPDLSPQDMTAPQFVDVNDSKNAQDTEIVSESVDDTDLHLYLSGVSDEEQSPKKEPGVASHVNFLSDMSLYPEMADSVSVYDRIKDSSISVNPEKEDSDSIVKTNLDKPFGTEELLTTQKLVLSGGKEPKKRGRPKKGSRGQPPGIPMTDEERLKRKDEEKLKRRKALKAFTKKCENQTLLQFLRTSQRSVDADFVTVPSFSGSTGTPTGSFSLRKKSTRSPLEMLAMKRQQEEAKYDMEEERRQARLIHLREKRSARESIEGFSDEEVGEESSENLMTCSVVLNDFVKKLQLDELELSSGEEVSHETPGNVRPREASPDYNPCEDRGEDWCADFEEHNSEEWNNNRPSIPRLKLKRIIKKGIQSHIKSTKLSAQPPKEQQHEPIKLVIKTEPVVEPNEQAGLRLSSGFESSKVERSGFENSYMDFLKKKSQPVPGKSNIGSKRSFNAFRQHVHLEEGTQKDITDLSAVEILSLPTSGAKGALVGNTESYIAGAQAASTAGILSGSTSFSGRPSALAQTTVGANADSCDKLSNLEHPGTAKPVVSVDDEEDDILIVDLEDGAVEHTSEDLTSVTGCASSDVHQASGIASAVLAVSHENASENQDSHVGSASLIHLQRSYSNDEMGLMFESYNSQKDPTKVNPPLGVSQVTTASCVNIGNFEDLSGEKETGLHSDISQPLSPVFKDTSVITTVGLSQAENCSREVQKSHTVGLTTDVLTESTEASRKGTAEIGGGDSALVADGITETEALFTMSQIDGDVLTSCKKQNEGESIPKVNRAADNVIMNTLSKDSNNDGQNEGNVLEPEVLASTTNKAVENVPSDASSDNNNVTSVCTSSLKTGSFKKPVPAGDNNKSPKHATYHGSAPEDWRVKVILHSDKFSSGKYSCKRCSFTAPAKLTIESHIYSHIPGVQFRCAYCESEFSSMAATSSHLKNTHSLNEAKLHISRHIDEKNFYDKEVAVFSEEGGQQSPVHPTSAGTNTGGQSPPVIISLVVSSRGGRSSSGPAHRFVCTHCGFSTNVKEDAEHHVLDLHSSQALFACLLCSENVCYTENEIKDHCATVHPARKHPYKKLPDFYDAELLSVKEKPASQDDRDNIFERMSSLFQDETQPGISTIDHKQKAKEYLYLQEGWKEKTKVEADSTTAVDYPDENDETEEQSSPPTPVQVESLTESIHEATIRENEVFADHRCNSQVPEDCEGDSDLCETAELIHDDFITSSAGTATNVSNDSQVDSDTCSERHDQQTEQEESFSDQIEEVLIHVARETTEDEDIQQECHMNPDLEPEENDDDGGGMGLKIVQVVSLSEQSQDIDEQMGAEEGDMQTDNSAMTSDICQVGTVMSEKSSTSINDELEFSASENSSAPADSVTVTESSVTCSIEEGETATSGTVVTTQSSATDSSTTFNSVSSPIASPSFAGGLPLSYKCNACKVHTPYLLMMVKHLKAKHPNMRCFSCPYCKTAQSFVSQKQLRHHVKQSHPTKFGRNEIALSEDAKKFVEAMVLPIGPECIRVGNRIVLEEDIHTCTYCQVKMVSLTSVYEHLNTKHSDLFEFVCPVCQNFRSKLLPEIFEHCLQIHKSSLDTDKVHVSVPKNLFTALTCISKSGKYIEKSLGISPEKSHAGSSSSTSQQSVKAQAASFPRQAAQLPTEGQVSSSEQRPLSESSPAATPLISVAGAMPTAQFMQPIFAVPLTSTSLGAVLSASRPVIPFSSSLFDTSSLSTPQLAVACPTIPFVQNAAASSFLSPLPQQAHNNYQHVQPSKQSSHSKSSERTHGSAKHLPVLNVPTIRPRASPGATKPVVGSPVDAMPLSASNCNLSVMSTPGAGQQSFRSTASSSIIDNLPDDEPNPDAFKIFNLCPTGPRISPAPVSSLPQGVPTVFPPVSAPMAAGYIQGPIAGFPPGMVISQNLLSLSFPYSQNQSVMQGLLAQKQNQQASSLSRHSHLSHTSALMAAQAASARRNSMSSEEALANAYLKNHQQRELYLKKQHQQQQQQLESQRHHLFRQSQQHAVPRAHPAHQQPPSLSGQVYQPQVQSLAYDHQQALAGPNDSLHPSLFSASVPVSSSAGPSGHLMAQTSPSPGRPSKGLHKRSNTLYQCPYCPVMVTLKALEVASHIQHHHPGKQVTFRKIA